MIVAVSIQNLAQVAGRSVKPQNLPPLKSERYSHVSQSRFLGALNTDLSSNVVAQKSGTSGVTNGELSALSSLS